MPLSPEVKYINNQLLKEFGLFFSRPRFRVVWTADQFEKRFAEYEDVDKDGLLVRRVTETREVPVYPYVKPPWWMLERAVEFQDESIKEGTLYEPLYLFKHFDSKGNYGENLPPRFDMAKVAIEMSLVKRPKRTYEMDKNEFDAKELRSEKDIFDKIKDATSDMSHLFRHKEAVIMDGKSDVLPTSPNLRPTNQE